MPSIPSFLAPYIAKAKRFNELSCLKDIEFSGPTYQVKIVDPRSNEEFWTFLHLDAQGLLQDAFCSCSESQEGGCWHLALSYMRLFDIYGYPLHERFARSFWNSIGKVWFKRYGEKRPRANDQWKLKGWKASTTDADGRSIFKDLVAERKQENEENSIKFSNLTEEELTAWRNGQPSDEFAYELSYWSDLAKCIMIYTETHKISLSFPENEGKLPDEVHVKSEDFEIVSLLAKEDWELIIPYLNTVSGNLTVFNRPQDWIAEVIYDETAEALVLHKKKLLEQAEGGLHIGDWSYLRSQGFFPRKKPFESKIKDDQISEFFDKYSEEMTTLLKNAVWHSQPVELKYFVSFDKEWNLHLDPYVDQKGDLQHTGVKTWGRWTYIPKKGFYRIAREKMPSVIPEDNVVDFIRHHLVWFNQQHGFMIHVGSLETHVAYHVNSRGALSFERRLPQDSLLTKDFGSWVYVKGEGFFSKKQSTVHLPLNLEHPIHAEMVPQFISQHRDDLEAIPTFFLDEDPFEEVILEARLEEKGRILVEPHYHLKQAYANESYRIYENWVYIKDRGFRELPPHQKLPEDMRDPVWITSDQTKEFLINKLPSIQQWVQSVDPRLVSPVSLRLVLTDIHEAPHHSWYLYFKYETDRGVIDLKDILEALRKKKPFLFSPLGRLDLFEERYQWLRKLPSGFVRPDGAIRLSSLELIRLHAFEEIIAQGKSSELFRDIVEFKREVPFDCSEMQCLLRPYQDKGARWLFALYTYLLGGLLCDEMGLGKTHQAMALMAAVRSLLPKARFLVVCPTSVLYHWEDKIKEFFPALKCLTFHGPFRRKDLEQDFSLLLTSYGILRNEGEWLKSQNFDVAFYDEIQVAKNHRSKLYAALQNVQADMKVGLTGTPIENRLRELKALFDLVLPGYMPSDSDYKRLIVRPIEQGRDMHKKGLLQRIIHPFVMRRKKVDVLIDLPDKTEEIAHCELLGAQEAIYRETLLIQREHLLKDITDSSKPIPFLHVFSLLSRLKQICDHPALYLKKPLEYKNYASGKWDLFVELLQEARESQQKVVVYSQYLGMLDIIEAYLKEEGIGFASLRGSTRDRKDQIALFAHDPSCEVFVASLKAAGLGIDLTAGSVVIHYDRWWNAARENQATDRVHRYGQHRGVQVFKMVTKNTFEERIHQIIERKKELLEEAIGIDDHEILKTFTRDELYQLLQYKEHGL